MGIKPRLFHNDKPIAGLDISTIGLKAMAIDPKKLHVLGYGSMDLDPAKVQSSMLGGDGYLAEALSTMLKERFKGHLPSGQVIVSVPTSRTYSRTMTVPAEAEKNLFEAVQLEVEQYIPITAADLSIDYEIIERNPKELTVLLAAVPKRIVQSVMSTCNDAGLEVVMIEPGINAAARIVKITEEGHLPSVIIDIGAASTDVGILDNGIVRLTGSVPVGGHTFTLRIAEGLKVNFEEAHQLKIHSGLASGPHQAKVKAALEGAMMLIITEIRKIIRYYNERIGVKTKMEQILVVGGGSNVPGIGEFITEATLMPARVGDPWHALDFGRLEPPSRQFRQRYITAAGLAIIDPKEIWQ